MTKSNNILIDDYKKLDAGFLEACDAVARTLGVEGRLAILDNNTDPPIVTKDGVSVMKHIRFSNKTMNFGALQAIAGAARTLEKSGDSTTTTAVFMQGFLRNLKRKKFNKAVERGIYKGVEEVYKKLEILSKKASKSDLKRIVKTACNNDEDLANIIIQAFDYAGKDGIVECIQNKDKDKTEFVKQDGMLLDSHGYTSPFFINREDKTVCFDGQNVGIICSATWEYSSKIIDSVKHFYSENNKKTPLVIFLERPHTDMTDKLVGIKEVGYNVCCVATNGYNEYESQTLLEDIANFTGASVYNPRDLESKVIFGLADKVVIDINSTSIVVENIPQIIKDKVAALEKADKKDNRRVKRLKGKASIIEVGGLTPSQQKETFDRVEDAIASVKTTNVEGYIAGGGSTLVHISGIMDTKLVSKEEQRGYDLVKVVLKEPFLKILSNANRKQSFFGKPYLKSCSKYGVGYNASTDEIANLIDDGVIDSKKSIRIALESATERAIQMFNISVIVHFPQEMTL